MADEITLDLIGEQLKRLLDEARDARAERSEVSRQLQKMVDEQGRVRDSITVLTGITIRLEGAVHGLTMEIAGLRSMVLDHDRRLRAIEETAQ